MSVFDTDEIHSVYIVSMANVPADIIKLLENIHKDFVWDKETPQHKAFIPY